MLKHRFWWSSWLPLPQVFIASRVLSPFRIKFSSHNCFVLRTLHCSLISFPGCMRVIFKHTVYLTSCNEQRRVTSESCWFCWWLHELWWRLNPNCPFALLLLIEKSCWFGHSFSSLQITELLCDCSAVRERRLFLYKLAAAYWKRICYNPVLASARVPLSKGLVLWAS